MHGHRQEEDGVTVIGSRASTEVLLHGLHYGEKLLCEQQHVMKLHLKERGQRRTASNIWVSSDH